MRGVGWRPWALLVWLLLVVGDAGFAPLHAQQPPRKPAEDEFLPISELPPEEKLPAAPLLIAAYSVAWVAVAGYLFSIWHRQARVERDIAEVSRRLAQRGGGVSGGPGAPQPRSGGGGG